MFFCLYMDLMYSERRLLSGLLPSKIYLLYDFLMRKIYSGSPYRPLILWMLLYGCFYIHH